MVRVNKKLHTTREWFNLFLEKLWLKSDNTGEDEARFLIRVLRLRKGDSVLDLPCGAGRISFHLAAHGCRVTGIDINSGFVRRAIQRFKQFGLQGRFLVGDMRELDFNDAFDAAVVWQGSFGYFSDKDNIDTIRRLARSLKPGGLLLVDQPNREHMLRNFIDTSSHGGITHRNRWNNRLERVESELTIHQDTNDTTCKSSIRLYTPKHMKVLFQKNGLCLQRIYGSATGESYSRRSRRLIALGKKQDSR